eukprot:13420416-Ditylum_brightwellii.AAC.1
MLVAEAVTKSLWIGQSGWSRKRAVLKVKPKDGQMESVVELLPRKKDGNLDSSVYWKSLLAKWRDMKDED